MGLRMDANDDNAGVGAFSEDILKIEISGPEVNSLPSYLWPPGMLMQLLARPSHRY